MVEENNHKGRVILAGAGPGDADLITVKLMHRLAEADIIIVDRLVNNEIIEKYARKDVITILSGKQGYHDGSTPQEAINKLIVEHAKKGETVLRLKGGDVAFFSNILDELLCLNANNIPFEIIPGITAGSGASAYSGIPLTARGYAKAVQFITYNACSNYSVEKWQALATNDDTLVFYMAIANLNELIKSLADNARPITTPLAIIEQCTTMMQKVHITNLENFSRDFSNKKFTSPSLVIVGEVVSLHQQFKWFAEGQDGTIFKELEDK